MLSSSHRQLTRTLAWRMLDTYGRENWRVTVVRVAVEPAYRAEFRGEHIGDEGPLRVAVERVHSVLVRNHAPGNWLRSSPRSRSAEGSESGTGRFH